MANTKKLQILIEAKNNADKELKKVSNSFKNIDKNVKIAGAAISGFAIIMGKQAFQSAATFSKAMSNVSTLVDTNVESMEDMKKKILDVSKRTPVALDDLTSALYDVRSAGIDAASAMEVLETSAMLGVAGLGTTKEATNLLTTAINAFGLQSRDSKEVADVLFKTVKAGKTDISKLSEAFGKMAGNAKAANISFEDTQAATAALTALTGKTSEAQNALAQVFLELTITGGKLDKQLGAQGLTLAELNHRIGEEGLVGGMKRMQEELGISAVEFKNMFSSAEGGTVVYQLLTDAFEMNKNALDNMKNGTMELTTAFEKQNKEATAQYQILKNQLNTELIKAGTVILPILMKAIENGVIVLKEWKGWFDSVADAIGTVIFKITQVINKLKEWKSAAGGFLTGSIRGSANIPGIPFFAEGGIVNKPTIGVIGEAGPEAVIPLSKIKNIGGGGNNIIINNTFNGDVSGEELIDKVKNSLWNSLQMNGQVAT